MTTPEDTHPDDPKFTLEEAEALLQIRSPRCENCYGGGCPWCGNRGTEKPVPTERERALARTIVHLHKQAKLREKDCETLTLTAREVWTAIGADENCEEHGLDGLPTEDLCKVLLDTVRNAMQVLEVGLTDVGDFRKLPPFAKAVAFHVATHRAARLAAEALDYAKRLEEVAAMGGVHRKCTTLNQGWDAVRDAVRNLADIAHGAKSERTAPGSADTTPMIRASTAVKLLQDERATFATICNRHKGIGSLIPFAMQRVMEELQKLRDYTPEGLRELDSAAVREETLRTVGDHDKYRVFLRDGKIGIFTKDDLEAPSGPLSSITRDILTAGIVDIAPPGHASRSDLVNSLQAMRQRLDRIRASELNLKAALNGVVDRLVELPRQKLGREKDVLPTDPHALLSYVIDGVKDLKGEHQTTVTRLQSEVSRLQRVCDEALPREVILCPACGGEHVDGANGEKFRTWPHHTHTCEHCGEVWDSERWSFGVASTDPRARKTWSESRPRNAPSSESKTAGPPPSPNDYPPAPDFQLGIYEHYKRGDRYHAFALALACAPVAEAPDWLVLYRRDGHPAGVVHARQVSEFQETVVYGNRLVPRFAFIEARDPHAVKTAVELRFALHHAKKREADLQRRLDGARENERDLLRQMDEIAGALHGAKHGDPVREPSVVVLQVERMYSRLVECLIATRGVFDLGSPATQHFDSVADQLRDAIKKLHQNGDTATHRDRHTDLSMQVEQACRGIVHEKPFVATMMAARLYSQLLACVAETGTKVDLPMHGDVLGETLLAWIKRSIQTRDILAQECEDVVMRVWQALGETHEPPKNFQAVLDKIAELRRASPSDIVFQRPNGSFVRLRVKGGVAVEACHPRHDHLTARRALWCDREMGYPPRETRTEPTAHKQTLVVTWEGDPDVWAVMVRCLRLGTSNQPAITSSVDHAKAWRMAVALLEVASGRTARADGGFNVLLKTDTPSPAPDGAPTDHP